MAWVWQRMNAPQEEQPLLVIRKEYSGKLTIHSRDIGPLVSETSDLESPQRMPSTPFAGNLGPMSDNTEVSQELWDLMRDGSGIQKLVDTCPEEVITVLKDHAVVKLGRVQASDSEVLKAFGKNTMLTRGCHSIYDPDFERHWKEYLAGRACQRPGSLSVGWEEKVTLGAYAVNIKDVAGRDRGALLQLLIQKYTSGATSKKIWDFPAVRAVINFHWQHWAQRFLLISAFIFLGWLIPFIIYIILYIERDDGNAFVDDEISVWKTSSVVNWKMPSILNFICFLFMIPFAIVEPWNLLDLSALMLQTFIFSCHLMGWPLEKKWFGYVLASQCVLLFTKLQYYGRVLGVGASISEIFIAVMYEVRYLLAYIILTGISASLCLGAMYKNDEGFHEKPLKRNFDNVRNSLVTTFQIMFGTFDTAYIFDADYPWVKMLFFFGLQVLMTITVLNLVIAVMTEAYSKFASDQRIRYNRGRALIIDELEVLGIPSMFTSALKPYIHFLVVEKRPKANASYRPSIGSLESPEDLKKKVDNMSEKLDTLLNLIAARNGDLGLELSDQEQLERRTRTS